jgi:hypothetical protein
VAIGEGPDRLGHGAERVLAAAERLVRAGPDQEGLELQVAQRVFTGHLAGRLAVQGERLLDGGGGLVVVAVDEALVALIDVALGLHALARAELARPGRLRRQPRHQRIAGGVTAAAELGDHRRQQLVGVGRALAAVRLDHDRRALRRCDPTAPDQRRHRRDDTSEPTDLNLDAHVCSV